MHAVAAIITWAKKGVPRHNHKPQEATQETRETKGSRVRRAPAAQHDEHHGRTPRRRRPPGAGTPRHSTAAPPDTSHKSQASKRQETGQAIMPPSNAHAHMNMDSPASTMKRPPCLPHTCYSPHTRCTCCTGCGSARCAKKSTAQPPAAGPPPRGEALSCHPRCQMALPLKISNIPKHMAPPPQARRLDGRQCPFSPNLHTVAGPSGLIAPPPRIPFASVARDSRR